MHFVMAVSGGGPRFIIENQWVIVGILVGAFLLWWLCKFSFLALGVIIILIFGFLAAFYPEAYTGDNVSDLFWPALGITVLGIYLYYKKHR